MTNELMRHEATHPPVGLKELKGAVIEGFEPDNPSYDDGDVYLLCRGSDGRRFRVYGLGGDCSGVSAQELVETIEVTNNV